MREPALVSASAPTSNLTTSYPIAHAVPILSLAHLCLNSRPSPQEHLSYSSAASERFLGKSVTSGAKRPLIPSTEYIYTRWMIPVNSHPPSPSRQHRAHPISFIRHFKFISVFSLSSLFSKTCRNAPTPSPHPQKTSKIPTCSNVPHPPKTGAPNRSLAQLLVSKIPSWQYVAEKLAQGGRG